MTTWQAAQIVYTRVDKDDSPVGVGGFQTVLYTRSLIEPDLLDEIEGHFRFDPQSSGEAQFFFNRVGKDQLLLAQLRAVETVDDCGRGGNFLAHGLVFSTEQFERAGGNPIEILRAVSFFDGPWQAADQANGQAGSIGPLRLTPARTSERPLVFAERLAAWRSEELFNLMLLAADAQELQRKRSSAVLIGPTSSMLDTLDLLYKVMPATLRPQLSFATHSPQAAGAHGGHVWARGSRNGSSRSGDCEVDLLLHTAEAPGEPVSSLGRWISFAMNRADIVHIIDRGDVACSISGLLDSSDGTDLLIDDDGMAEEVWQANKQEAEQRLRSIYLEKMGRSLANRAFPRITATYSALEKIAQIAASGDERVAADALHRAYCDLKHSPDSPERTELQKFANRCSDERLEIWISIWKRDWSTLTRQLVRLTCDQYVELIKDIGGACHVSVLRLFVPGRCRDFLDAIVSNDLIRDVRLTDLVWLLMDHDKSDFTILLLPELHAQSAGAVESLYRLTLRLEPDLPDRFVRTVDRVRQVKQSAGRSRRRSFFRWFC